MTNTKSLTKIALVVVAVFAILLSAVCLSACGKKEAEVTVSVQASDTAFETYFTGSTLPTLTFTSKDTELTGTISWDADQTVESGTKEYSWTFTPTDKNTYEKATGKIALTKVDHLYSEQTYTSQVGSDWVDGESYVYANCTFGQGVFSSNKVDLTILGGEITAYWSGNGGEKCIYLTSFTNLVVDDVDFKGTTGKGDRSSAGYAFDLNIYSTTVQNVVITNNNFETLAKDGVESVAISIKTRKGTTDHPTDGWASTATEGTITGKVLISGNTFADGCNSIYIGTDPKGDDTAANTTSGAFNVEVTNNKSAVNVYERYCYAKGVTVPAQEVKANTTASFGNKTAVAETTTE